MWEVLAGARHTVYLSTYIFETNESGRRFVALLGEAVRRGVEVKVLVDGIGELYSYPRATPLLAEAGVSAARFLPPRLWPLTVHINLRNHRKILAVDGRVAFVGGMNLGDRHLTREEGSPGVVDLHFRLEGPVVSQVERVFLDDWDFATGETTSPPPARGKPAGESLARALVDGPNHDLNKLTTLLVGAVSQARQRVTLMTPYFLPPQELIAALQAAALKGVEVTVLLPGKNNLPVVHWATRNLLWEVLQRGVRVFYQPPPFVHSKLFLVDGAYALIGSANLDPRSLRLNFELGVEVYDPVFVRELEEHAEACRERSREVTLAEVDGRSLPERFRDSLAWLFTPYL
jgi:cardiolipin synthase